MLRNIAAALLAAVLSVSAAGAGLTGLRLHQRAPDFARADLAGKPLRLSDLRGKLVLLNFWATWCAPCLAEIPRFSEWQRRYGGGGLQVLGVSMDDDSAPVLRLAGRLRLSYPVVLGDEQLGLLYGGIMGLPVTYLIDPGGRIAARYEGEPDLSMMEARIKTLLPKPR